MIELVLLVWVLVMATLWFARFLFDEAVAAWRGQTSPRVARRQAREQLARDWGVPTVGQAVSGRLARWIDDPPERRWAANLRELLAELVDDAVSEARVRHHRNRQLRARRAAGWRVRTGGPAAAPRTPPPPPDPDPDPDVLDTFPCAAGCSDGHVTEPGERCDRCAAAPPDPEPDPDPDPEPEPEPCTTEPDREEPPMSETHTINGDVRDPRTALAFATSCRAMNDGVARELDTLAAKMAELGVGGPAVNPIRVLEDAARTYSASNEKSARKYAEHVVAQAEIAGDDELRSTVSRTYLDTKGSDGAASAAPRAASGTRTVNAADCDSPAAGARFMDTVAAIYIGLKASVDQAKGKHEQQGVSDEPVAFLAEQLEYATQIAGQATQAARTFRRHVQTRDDTVGKDPSLHGTQKGRYLDPSKA